MQAFLHDRRKRFTAMLDAANVVLRRYNDHDLDLRRRVVEHLDAAVSEYRDLGLTHRENELLALQSCYALAVEGMHPSLLEPVVSRRRAFERAVAFHVLNASSERIRADHDEVERLLDGGRDQLKALVLHALALGVIRGDQPLPADQVSVERLWRAIAAHPELALGARQVALSHHAVDITLLLADLLVALAIPTPEGA